LDTKANISHDFEYIGAVGDFDEHHLQFKIECTRMSDMV